ncbi:G protein-coupled glucose receptor regulating Gpa2-domain-containing protein [Bisporella sp. PMI_857]|nr:G protein-coupled glucose receptor regulating Gpa2-domain-containing protein [Bisporella sp. PMI_857]
MVLDDKSGTLIGLPTVLSKGLIAVSVFGLLSFVCTSLLFIFLTYKIIRWRLKEESKGPINQFLFLIYNLLFADIQQGLAFMLNIAHLQQDSINVESSTCWAQGWFVSTGDLASSLFIFAIALHTFMAVVKDYRPPSSVFYTFITSLWVFNYVLGIIGPVMHGKEFFVRASSWCWVNHVYPKERLWLHYFWIFAFMFGTVIIYSVIFLFLQRRSTHENLANGATHGATPLMLIYPLIYVVCTSPLAIGRISSLAGNTPSLAYFCVAGSMIACNGWMDVLLYASTRRDIVFSEHAPGEETGLETFAFLGKGHKMGNTTIIQANHQRTSSRLARGDSAENLYGLDQIGIKENVTVTTEPAIIDRRRTGDKISSSQGSWDGRSGKSLDA